VIDGDQAGEIDDRDRERTVGDENAGGEVRIVGSPEWRAEDTHEERIERQERHVRQLLRGVSVPGDGEVGVGVPTRRRIEKRIAGEVARFPAGCRLRQER